MSLIVGVEYCKTDAGGRFKLPVAIKKQLDLTSDNRFFIRKSIYNECLELFTYNAFQQEVSVLQKSLNPYDPDAKRLYRRFIEGNMIELDSFDRLLLPPALRSNSGIGKDIILVGSGNYVEIWSEKAYQAINDDNFDYQSAAKNLLSKNNDR